MDNFVHGRTMQAARPRAPWVSQTRPMPTPAPGTTWSPRPGLVGLAWLAAAVSLAGTVLGGQSAGRLLTGVATIGLALLALHGTMARPRLRADADGITVRQLFGSQRWPWRTVLIKVTNTRRFGRNSYLLELDGEDVDGVSRLAVLGQLDLGGSPEDVAATLRRLQP